MDGEVKDGLPVIPLDKIEKPSDGEIASAEQEAKIAFLELQNCELAIQGAEAAAQANQMAIRSNKELHPKLIQSFEQAKARVEMLKKLAGK
jgi:hypothetical protein